MEITAGFNDRRPLIWLPLNGNMINKGTANVTITNNSSTPTYSYGNAGLVCPGNAFWKIGNITLGSNVSICWWSKTTVNARMVWVLESNVSSLLNLYEYNIYTLNMGDGLDNPFKDNNGNNINVLHDGKWHHFVVVFTENSVILFIDGKKAGTALTYRNPTSSNKIIKLAGGFQNAHANDWNGEIKDFRVYNYALGPELLDIYNFYENIKIKSLFNFNDIDNYKQYIANYDNYKYINDNFIYTLSDYFNTTNPGKLYYGKNNFKFIEYIETHGYCSFPNSNIIPNDANWKFECVMMMIDQGTGNFPRWFGTYDGESANTYRILKNGNNSYNIHVSAYSTSGGTGTVITTSANIKYKLTIYQGTCIKYDYSNNTTTSTTLNTSQGTAILTKMYVGTSGAGQIGRYYMFNTYHNGELVGAMRPIMDFNGNYGFYDLLNGVIIYNEHSIDANNFSTGPI